MRADHANVQACLDAWRRQGADRLDPPRFRLIEALAARALRHEGAARQLLDARLAQLLEGYAAGLAGRSPARHDTRAVASAGGALAPLLAQMAAARRAQAGSGDAGPAALPALDEFRQLWGRMLGEKRLRQSLAPPPADAGPLNSGVLALRAIALMRDTSPEYLRHFLAYADHLGWLERLHESRTSSAATPGRRTAPRKPRKRRE